MTRTLLQFPLMLAGLLALAACSASAAELPALANSAGSAARPTLFLIGDSTVKNSGGRGTNEARGWGNVLGDQFDQRRINVRNCARGGRSSRTYFTEGLWDEVLAGIKPGDFVLIQFGTNDGSAPDDEKSRGSLAGIGDESRVITNKVSGKVETVRTFGWYLRKYVRDTKAKGATPIVLSLVPRNDWSAGKVIRASEDYGKWAGEVAQAEGAAFVDLNELVARRYEELGAEKVGRLFGPDHTHTSPPGAKLSAECVAEGLRELKGCALTGFLLSLPARFQKHRIRPEDAGKGRKQDTYKEKPRESVV